MMGSPMNYFDAHTGGRQGMFQMGAQIGALNSPASGPTSAIKQVLERARAWTDRQQAMQVQKELDNNRIGQEYEQKKTLYGNGGNVLDLTSGATAPAGYEMVPDYQIDSTRGQVVKSPKYIKQQDPIDAMIAGRLGQGGAISDKPVAGKGKLMPWERDPDVEFMKQVQETARMMRELKAAQAGQ